MPVGHREQQLRRRIHILTCLVILGLVISGATAIPLTWELDLMVRWLGIADLRPSTELRGLTGWIHKVWYALVEVDDQYPFISYGTDWLAFGHVVIAIVFFGALRDPVRNRWLFKFGMIACALVIPWAFIFGHLRGIPVGWRLIDCTFGLGGFIPLWLAHKYVAEIESIKGTKTG